jgi:hypothetical protein
MKYSERKLATRESPTVEEIMHVGVPAGQSMKSHALSRKKMMLDKADGGSNFVDNLLTGPINDMYLAIRAFSAFPHGAGMVCLIHDTKANGQC